MGDGFYGYVRLWENNHIIGISGYDWLDMNGYVWAILYICVNMNINK